MEKRKHPDLEQNGGRGPRCTCGHYLREHGPEADLPCHGAYSTLMADADDFVSVEVPCSCEWFHEPDADHVWDERT
jgi:hypothetical protein